MELIIDIDEDYYELIKHDVKNGMDYLPCKLIANGIPLPRQHGRLIDADAPTIIEADKDDFGDYPDTIKDQFDNMTGSLNL